MQPDTTKKLSLYLLMIILPWAVSCSMKSNATSASLQLNHELATIDSLIRDEAFTLSMAKTLEASYYAGIAQTPPEFLTAQEDTATVTKSVKEEKIATSLAGFYAVECGVGMLSAQTGETPVVWLQKITGGTADTSAILLLNRFANATWKAGQPFRSLSRITRPNFIVASSLSADELKKDYVQISNAASRLLSSMQPVTNGSIQNQMQTLRSLLQDTVYAIKMAAYLDSTFAVSQHQQPAPFLTAADDTATITKRVKHIKIATNAAGWYALECGLNYLVTTKHLLPSAILHALVSDSLSAEDNMIFARFANATWKAGQPFRGLSRITRETFTPFYFLSEADIDKDRAQIKAAANKLLSML